MGASAQVSSPVILFDGVCNLCNGSVQFIIKRDRKNRFHFAALQSSFGLQKLNQLEIPTESLQSIVLIDGEKNYQKSNAVLEISKHLGGAWPMLYVFKIVPRFLRDAIYNFIAKNRYRWFGRQDQCMIPTPALKTRFIE
ncbi:MAG TPA: thiol-disulfide oxidoreductase DCC family protein [Cyclobacteriaceae bacterium]